jgi:hypothetical protein
VIPKLHPNQIVEGIFTAGEKDLMIKLLIAFQKIQTDWDAYRKKIPDNLLEKWADIMLKCRENGFVAPRVYDNQIHWKQIMGLHTELSDECTMCPSTFVSGECKGRLKLNAKNERVFVPCWKI